MSLSLVAITRTDIELAEQLLVLIDQEYQALVSRKLDELEALLGTKQVLLKQLDQHAQQRSELLRAQGLSADPAGLSHYAATLDDGADLLAASARLLEVIETCKARNVRNGHIIDANRLAIGKLLNVVQGSAAPALYDNRGGQRRSGQQRPLSSA